MDRQSKEELIILAEVTQAAELWEKRGRHQEELWSGAGLERPCALGRGQNLLPALTEEFLEMGKAVHEIKPARRRFWTAAIPIILIIITAILALQKFDAEESRAVRTGRQQALHQRKICRRAAAAGAEPSSRCTEGECQAAFERGATLNHGRSCAKVWNCLVPTTHRFLAYGGSWPVSPSYGLFERDNSHHHASGNGRQLAISSVNGSVELVDVETSHRRLLRGHKDQVLRSVFDPSDQMLASGAWAPSFAYGMSIRLASSKRCRTPRHRAGHPFLARWTVSCGLCGQSKPASL